MEEPGISAAEPATAGQKLLAWLVHVYTASGIVFALLATLEICRPETDPRRVFALLALAVLVDATDGTLARRWRVKRRLPQIDGRTIDDIVDYFTFTFVPLLLVWRMPWLPAPAELWISIALVTSLLGFANTHAKQEEQGFFLGFPSYWNIVAFYLGLSAEWTPPWLAAAAIVLLAAATVAPLRFIYPSLAPRAWRFPVLAGALAWFALLVAMLPEYPHNPPWLVLISLIYPLFYVALSLVVDARLRRAK